MPIISWVEVMLELLIATVDKSGMDEYDFYFDTLNEHNLLVHSIALAGDSVGGKIAALCLHLRVTDCLQATWPLP